MDDLFKTCEGLINSIANKFYGIEREDLLQAGRTGLLNAYNHYDRNSNTKFSTFAYSYIFGEMYNLSITSKSIKTNRDTLKLIKLIEKTKNYLTQTLNKVPSAKEIAEYLNIDEETINNAYNLTQTILSLDKDDEDISLYNKLILEENNDLKLDLLNSINSLPKEEQDIIKYRYYGDLTQSETAKIMGMSQVSVSRYEQKSLKKLKNMINV